MKTDSLLRRETVPVVIDRVRERVSNRTHDETVMAATAAGFVILLVGVLAMHGFLWGQSQPMLQTILDAGAIKCLHDQGFGALGAHCNAVGQPIGLTFITGMPETMLGWLLSWVPGIDAWAAHQLLNVILDAVALAGGYLLLRRWSVVRPIALLAAAVYLVSPSLISVYGFQYTFTGYTFLPLYTLLFLKGLDGFSGDGLPARGIGYLAGVTFLMTFTDGYSYATALLLLGVTLVWWVLGARTISRGRKLSAVLTFAASNALAVALYSAYVNVPPQQHFTMGQYRNYSLDVVTLFIPISRLVWPSNIGYHPPSLVFWGDGGNFLHNYMGFGMIALVIWLFSSRRFRSEPASRRRELVPLFVGALLALLFSLGPALRIDSRTSAMTPGLDMPLGKAFVGLPTSFLYAHVPPFTTMRAAFRWSIGFRFVLIFAAAYATTLVWRSGRRVLAAVLILLAALEIAPPPRFELRVARTYAHGVSSARRELLPEFDALTKRGERVLIVPSANDFLANALAPFAHVKTYNAGIDKNYAAARAAWPSAVLTAADGIYQSAGQGERIASVLQHDADAVVISYVDLQMGGTTWPAPAPNVSYLRQQAAALSHDPRFVTRQGKLMTVVRLRTGAGRVTG